MTIRFFDAHTHAQFAAFNADRDDVIARSRAAGVGMVNVGTNKSTSEAAIALSLRCPDLCWATVGLHPVHTAESFHDAGELASKNIGGEDFDHELYKKLAVHPKVVAIGECGLDYFHVKDEKSKKKQMEAFVGQIELAHEVKKPLMIHCRSAFPELIEILSTNRKLLNATPGVIHFFSGTADEAKKLLGMGFYFTFGGVITFTRDYDEIVKVIPFDMVLSETDAPYVAPVPYRGKRNEPAYVIEVVKKLADLKQVSVEVMAGRILKNARRIFGIEI